MKLRICGILIALAGVGCGNDPVDEPVDVTTIDSSVSAGGDSGSKPVVDAAPAPVGDAGAPVAADSAVATVPDAGSRDGAVGADARVPDAGRVVDSGTSVADSGSPVVVDSGAPPVATGCGNGKLETGEQCDDGNQVDLDGCSSKCTNLCEMCLATEVRTGCKNSSSVLAPSGGDVVLACKTLSGTGASGPGKGKPRSQLCLELVSCMRRTGCDAAVTEMGPAAATCLCGDVKYPSCFASGEELTGPCAREVYAAAETIDTMEVWVAYKGLDSSRAGTALGLAMAVVTCEHEKCADECFDSPCKGKPDGTSCEHNTPFPGVEPLQVCKSNSCGDGPPPWPEDV